MPISFFKEESELNALFCVEAETCFSAARWVINFLGLILQKNIYGKNRDSIVAI
jgi:hypothetical protein